MHATETALRNALRGALARLTELETQYPEASTTDAVNIWREALAMPEVPVTLPRAEPTSNHGYLIIDSDGETTYCDEAQRVEDHLNELFSMNGPSLDGVEVHKITRTREVSYEINIKLIEN